MDARLLGQLVRAAIPVLTGLALVLAFRPRPAGTAVEASLARAQWLSVAVSLPGAYLLLVTVVRAVEGNPLGIVVYLASCGYVAAAAVVLRWVWCRHRAVVREHQPVLADDGPPARHRGLSGEGTPPPTRW